MGQRYFIITGTSKGIGKKLAELLLQKGDYVYGIARGTSGLEEAFERYMHIQFDLADIHSIDDLVSSILEQIPPQEVEFIGLINNAAMLEPLKPIDQCIAEEISQQLHISLAAPMILTSSFIQQTSHLNARRKIVNVSSGSGSYPAPSMASYCTSKAGINMFTQCVAMELSGQPNPVEVIAFDPGMVDTELQAVARGKSAEEFALSEVFGQVYEAGQLRSPQDVAKQLIERMEEISDPSEVPHTMEG
ncbi:SDR family NAD(P)-dependent oxidoreductase [Paenibacillus sp. UMB7766-LJ446]|uniref:SDR family NAD(P)-dependent oxidoreductase n=1 Tax=Paenibacillus sp. UMB7766-LJ446 TaxID=3046313 RepID=UPI00254AC4E5|nr:SDR family NAD(P)-dependent oxidoreductase [Paenibacillus sp. UMB7766-LJ446]MDK8189098.1 SDR family NAD(P)-dependent oxidoreductase [Paenibacillus sp. UMB7766-LJ446]